MKFNEGSLQVVGTLDQEWTHLVGKLDVIAGLVGETILFNWKPIYNVKSGHFTFRNGLGKTESGLLDRFRLFVFLQEVGPDGRLETRINMESGAPHLYTFAKTITKTEEPIQQIRAGA